MIFKSIYKWQLIIKKQMKKYIRLLVTGLTLALFLHAQSQTWLHYQARPNQLGGNQVLCLATDVAGNVWVGGVDSNINGFVSRYDGSHWTTYTDSNSALTRGLVLALACDSVGNVWISTGASYGGGTAPHSLCKFDGTNWTVYSNIGSVSYLDNILSITFDAAGNLWCGTEDATNTGGVCRFDGSNWMVYNYTGTGGTNDVGNVTIDASNGKWVGTVQGIYYYDNANWSFKHAFSCSTAAIDNNGTVWFGNGKYFVSAGYAQGAIAYDGQNWSTYTSTSGLGSNTVNCVITDTANNKWFGTKDNGVAILNGSTWKYYNTGNSGIASNNITSMVIDKYGNKWFATADKGVSELTDSTGSGQFSSVNTLTGLARVRIYPNPAKNYLVIETADNAAGTQIEIYDMAGRLMKVVNPGFEPGAKHLDVTGYAPGAYLVKVTSAGLTTSYLFCKI